MPENPPTVAVPARPAVAPRPVVWTTVVLTVPNDGWPNPPAPWVNAPVAPGRPKYIGLAYVAARKLVGLIWAAPAPPIGRPPAPVRMAPPVVPVPPVKPIPPLNDVPPPEKLVPPPENDPPLNPPPLNDEP